ncbi:MAG TPA: MarC family protein [Xanthomonadales bacterium]|nr:MarC family protein [Xanthomonadales bacterium]
MDNYLQAIATVVSLVNPVTCGIIFLSNEPGRNAAQRLKDATMAALAILVILSLAALFGAAVLNLFGISLDAFSVAGGGVLVWMGFSILRGASAASPAAAPSGEPGTAGLMPVILFGASPGTLTGVITLAVSHSRSSIPLTALVAVATASLLTWLVMVLLSRKAQKPGSSFVQSVVQSFMGLIVMAMGVQFGLRGLGAFMHSIST